jgi:ribosomal protein S18 acetylase RimI-like enzyme
LFRDNKKLLNDFAIRIAGKEDQSFLREILYECVFTNPGEAIPPKEIIKTPELAKYVENWGKPDDFGLIMFEILTKKPVGAIWIRNFTRENKGYGFVDEGTPELSIALLPEFRGHGLGSSLIKKLIEKTRGKYKAISLSVNEANPALNLYKRFGFIEVDKTGSSITMKKELY